MAIQVYRTSQNFNSPIWVAGVSQAPTRLANAFSQVTENIAQMQYKVDVRKQEEQALDTVSQMSLRETDENDPTGRGTLVFKKLPVNKFLSERWVLSNIFFTLDNASPDLLL